MKNKTQDSYIMRFFKFIWPELSYETTDSCI